MNTQKAVYNKLFSKKTELETHKVELGIMQDLSKALSKHKKARKSLDDNLDKWYNDLFKLKDKFSTFESKDKEFKSSLSDMKKFVKEIETMSKDLGIKPTAIEDYQESKALINTSEDIDDSMKDARKLANKIG